MTSYKIDGKKWHFRCIMDCSMSRILQVSFRQKMAKFIAPVVSLCLIFQTCSSALNSRPIIGILTRELVWRSPENKTSVIEAAYVKHLESSGARVVPILIHQDKEYYQNLLGKINGVLFPGGPDILKSDGYGRSGKIIFDIAVQMNDGGGYFPLWGTCLGFEMLSYLMAGKIWFKNCAARDIATNLEFVDGFDRSRMFENLEGSMKKIMEKETVAANFHNWCLTPENYTKSGLDQQFKVLAFSEDSNNEAFVAAMEAYNYPFYGIAFHPEKVQFEFVVSEYARNIPHTVDAVRASQYFSNFFVDEARKNFNKFSNLSEEDSALIYNYNPVFTAKYDHYPSEQNYFF